MIRPITIIVLMLYSLYLNAQGTIVQNTGQLVNSELTTIQVTGDVVQENNTQIKNAGQIQVQGDWVNNSLIAGLDTTVVGGEVVFIGGDQQIKGSNVTYFYHLIFDGNGIKSADNDIYIRASLNLGNDILEVNNNKVHLINPAPNALSWNGGYITSNNIEGYFLRGVNTVNAYSFPVGSSALNENYRTVEITPTTSDSSVFGVRLGYGNAGSESGVSAAGSIAPYDLESKNQSLSVLHPDYYWAVNRFYGQAEANAVFYTFSSDAENIFTALAKWNSSAQQWEKAKFNFSPSNGLIPEIGNPDVKITSSTALTYEDDIYVLSDINIIFPQVITPNNDGVNDELIIEHIELYPDNSIQIYNRWGEQVFEAAPYQNDWRGQNQSPSIKIQGEELQSDTYFYILKLGEDEPVIKRYIELIKN